MWYSSSVPLAMCAGCSIFCVTHEFKVKSLPCFFFFLCQNLPVLSEEEESQVMQVIMRLSDQVLKKRLMMYQYFKDYDRVGIH